MANSRAHILSLKLIYRSISCMTLYPECRMVHDWCLCMICGFSSNLNPSLLSGFPGSCAYAYGITQIVTIVSNLSKATVRFQARMDLLHEYMTVRSLPKELCHRILEFYEFKMEHSCAFLQEDDILADLPHSLRAEVTTIVHSSLARQLGEMELFRVGLCFALLYTEMIWLTLLELQ